MIGQDVVIEPHVVFGPGVTVDDGVEILGFSHIEGARIARGARIGPYARLRPGAEIGEGAHVGNFVEVKKATIGKGAKANHLSYIGDARVGAGSNIGAGTITCNYDGFDKHLTEIGADVFVGSNTALVAPVSVGDGATIAAGSVIARNVPGGCAGHDPTRTRCSGRLGDALPGHEAGQEGGQGEVTACVASSAYSARNRSLFISSRRCGGSSTAAMTRRVWRRSSPARSNAAVHRASSAISRRG